MKAIHFIEKRLETLIKVLPQLKLSYEFDDFDDSHLIEVLPAKIFKEDVEYAKLELQLIDDFITKFPNEGIGFITENDLVEISNPFFVLEGSLFNTQEISWNLDDDFISNFEVLPSTKIISMEFSNPIEPNTFKENKAIKETIDDNNRPAFAA